MGLRDLAKRAIGRAISGGAAPSSPPPPRPAAVPSVPSPPHKATAAPPPPADGETDRAAKPWFLQDAEDVDGWDETNPGQEPGQKNLRR
ncbi:MAG: hypothetical protein EXR71_03140 [Myxococcales bacterium]|nr:hypothetical protein [Myxococcales bacterium]